MSEVFYYRRNGAIIERYHKINHALQMLHKGTGGVIRISGGLNICQKLDGRLLVWTTFFRKAYSMVQSSDYWKRMPNKNHQ